MRNKIIYWIATVWLALGMLSSAIVQLLNVKEEVEMINHLGYPLYFVKILAVWKIFGLVALFAPRFPLVKEWAYAGFFFRCRVQRSRISWLETALARYSRRCYC